MPNQDNGRAWWDGAEARLDHLSRLPLGWDGYQGRAVDAAIVSFALRLLESVCGVDTPTPSIVPGASGDLQIEWHTSGWDLGIDVTGPYRVKAWRRNATSTDEDDLTLTNDFTELRKWVGQIAEPTIAARTASHRLMPMDLSFRTIMPA